MAFHHGLGLIDRGTQHIHRWLPSCRCGWIGVPRRRKREAVDEHHDHLNALVRHSRKIAGMFPRPPTPVELLPDALRPGVATDPNPR